MKGTGFVTKTREPPPKEELVELMKTMTQKKLCKHYGVSVFTMTKWLYRMDLKTTASKSVNKDATIPVSVFGPILKELLDEFQMWFDQPGPTAKGVEKSERGMSREVDGYNLKAQVIGKRAGVSERRIIAIIKDEQRMVKFQTADSILCALDKNYLWHTHPQLRELYWEGCPKPDDWEANSRLVEVLVGMRVTEA